jgi:hypothetical protein
MRSLSRYRGPVFLLLLAGVLAGCQGEASTVKTPAAQPSAEGAVQTSQLQPAGDPGEPVELEVAVLAPKITVEKPVLDLGEVGTDSKNTGQFRLTNTGNAPLKILRVHSCCGVSTRGIEDGQEYAPGESGVLEFEYLTGSTPDSPVVRELRLQTNDPEQVFVSLVIKAAVVRRVEYTPLKIKLFLRQENAGCEDITIRSLDGKPFSIADIRSTANAISAEFDPNVQATEFVLKPRADMEKLPRNIRGVVSVDLTHPECGNVRVPFDVLPEFTINPAQLMVWNLRAGQAIQSEVRVRGNYRDEFEIESVSSQKGMITLLDKARMDDYYQLRLEIKAPPREGENALATDVLEVKIKDGETVSIPCRGVYVEG